MKIYRGNKGSSFNSSRNSVLVVIIEDQEKGTAGILDPKYSQSIMNHSPDGFNWGYGGSGPSQLALAIVLDLGMAPWDALTIHQKFKEEVIAAMPDNWERNETQFRTVIDRLLKAREKSPKAEEVVEDNENFLSEQTFKQRLRNVGWSEKDVEDEWKEEHGKRTR